MGVHEFTASDFVDEDSVFLKPIFKRHVRIVSFRGYNIKNDCSRCDICNCLPFGEFDTEIGWRLYCPHCGNFYKRTTKHYRKPGNAVKYWNRMIQNKKAAT